MSDKSNKYGYVGVDIPAQSFGSNKGVFNPAEINELVANNQWTSFGQLELIETQTVSSASALDFTSLGNYNVHFVTVSNVKVNTDAQHFYTRFSNNGGTSFISSNSYQYAKQYGTASGAFSAYQTTGFSGILNTFTNGTATGESSSLYSYFYNLLDSSKYSFQTSHSTENNSASDVGFVFGSAVLPIAEVHNAIRFYPASGTFSATASLYGIRYS